MPPPDRLKDLAASTTLVALDFVYVDPDQRHLYVFFHESKAAPDTILTSVTPGQVSIVSPSGGESLPTVPLDKTSPPAWTTLENRKVLGIVTSTPGDFSLYRLSIDDPRVDPYFREATFSF